MKIASVSKPSLPNHRRSLPAQEGADDAYAGNVFYAPPEARWKRWATPVATTVGAVGGVLAASFLAQTGVFSQAGLAGAMIGIVGGASVAGVLINTLD